MSKTSLQAYHTNSMQKNRPKKRVIFEKWDHFEYWPKWPPCKGYSLCKIIILGQKIKLSKTYQKRVYKHIIVILWKKNCSKKHLIFQKWDHFEYWPNWPPCKGYNLFKIITLVQKIKLPKTYQKWVYKHIILILCEKPLEKTPNIREMRPFSLLAKMASMRRL